MASASCYGHRLRAVLVVCLLAVQPVLTLRCYVCDSLDSEDCGDYFRVLPSEASTCPEGSRCVKFRGFRGSGVVKSPEVHRYCSLDFPSNGCRSFYRNGIDGDACVCRTELCNTSSPVRSSSLWMLVLLLPLIGWCFTS